MTQEAIQTCRRITLCVRGAVQGVGFRPFVFRLANELELSGWVENTPQGVTIELEGPEEALRQFPIRLTSEKPGLAQILSSEQSEIALKGDRRFEIRHSGHTGSKTALVLPDIATCPDCLREILDPNDRRFGYAFTNCTNCGPRFSIIEALPYDRAHTSMKKFAMCEDCRREYEDPVDRRFHAQPNACPKCGPRLELWDSASRRVCAPAEALEAAALAIRAGRILALKGLGGFQLIVDARNGRAVAELRRRKGREEKPFALMAPSLAAAEQLAHIDHEERRLLESPQAPIVLVKRRVGASLVAGIAPGNPYLGIMLPYTPLHHLLLLALGFPVVATSGNFSDEPICTDEAEAVQRLAGIADIFLVHDRPIVRHMDDSVVRIVRGRETLIRRARGYAPWPIRVPEISQPIVAVGAHQKNTVALAAAGQVLLSQHIGDLATPEASEAFDRSVADLPALYEVRPGIVAHDLHPDYFCTKRAGQFGCRAIVVQHHHAHVVSCMAEHQLDGDVLGVSWDGTGYGTDGTIWGGEFLRCDRRRFERISRLRTFRLPGGERAAREPRRCALGLLYELLGDSAFERMDLAPIQAFGDAELRALRAALHKNVNCPVTSSMGRLFDAVASILDIRQRVRDEGQAAMELQFAAETFTGSPVYPLRLENRSGPDGMLEVDWGPMMLGVLGDVKAGVDAAAVARRFHDTLVEMIVSVTRRVGAMRIVLTGGCFQNTLLLDSAIARLEQECVQVYWHQQIPTNDGGIALGQAVVAQALLDEELT